VANSASSCSTRGSSSRTQRSLASSSTRELYSVPVRGGSNRAGLRLVLPQPLDAARNVSSLYRYAGYVRRRHGSADFERVLSAARMLTAVDDPRAVALAARSWFTLRRATFTT
jgi:hypothetical protein